MDDGAHVVVHLESDGFLIERLAGPKGDGETLFRGSVDQAAEIAVAFLNGRPAQPDKVLDVFLAAVSELGSADAVRQAFTAATAAIDRP